MFEKSCPKCHAGMRARDESCRNCTKTVGKSSSAVAKPQPPKRWTGDARGIRLPEPVEAPMQSPGLMLKERLERAEVEPVFAEAAMSAPAAVRPEKRARKRKGAAPAALPLEEAAQTEAVPALDAEPSAGDVSPLG